MTGDQLVGTLLMAGLLLFVSRLCHGDSHHWDATLTHERRIAIGIGLVGISLVVGLLTSDWSRDSSDLGRWVLFGLGVYLCYAVWDAGMVPRPPRD